MNETAVATRFVTTTRRGALLLALATLLVPGWATAQPALGGSEMPPNDAVHQMFRAGHGPPIAVTEADKAGKAKARIRVVRQSSPDGKTPGTPQASVPVELVWQAVGAQQDLMRWAGISDSEGWAMFEGVDVLGDPRKFELRARAMEGAVQHTSPRLFAAQGVIEGELAMVPVSGDPSVVVGGSHVTILRIPEGMSKHPSGYGHVEVQQVLELTTNDFVIYDSSLAMSPAAARGVAIELPLKAQGASGQALGRGGELEVAESTVYYAGVVYPAAEGYPSTRLMAAYYLKASGSELNFEQPMNRAWADVRVTFLRATDLPNHPVVDVSFAEHGFAEETDEADEGTLQGERVKVLRGLSLLPGDVLRFKVEGLPYPEDRIPLVLAGLAGLLIVGGVFLGLSEARKSRARRDALRRGAPEAIAAIDARIEVLYAGLTELERDWESGEVDDDAYELEQARLKARIALLMQRKDTARAAA